MSCPLFGVSFVAPGLATFCFPVVFTGKPGIFGGGRPPADDRQVLEGILWILRSGARWCDLPEEFPSPSTCWRRLRDWEEQEVWLEIWRAFLSELNERQQLKWSESFMDGSFAPAKKGATESEKPSGVRVRSGWWWSTARVFL
jgi:transposase